MAVTSARVSLTEDRLSEIQEVLRDLGLRGWLLFDFRGSNPIAASIIGLPPLSRRVFVLIPAVGRPVAVTHCIEQQPWEGWIGERRIYLGWQSLAGELGSLLAGVRDVAMEYSPEDAVPYVDRIPAGVLEMVRAAGATPTSSADLVAALYSRWSEEGEASHRRAGYILRDTANAAFEAIGRSITAGSSLTEWAVRDQILSRLAGEGLAVGADAVVAVGSNAANPHYAPARHSSASIRAGDLVLIDLWGKEGPESVYADQTWMGFVGDSVPDRVEAVWRAVRDAREAAVAFIRAGHRQGRDIAGFEVDDVSRGLIAERGFGEYFIHRTGHSIDRELHGSGPNLDNLETKDERRLISGVGFSVEPGIYLPGELGIRSEIDVFMSPDGPTVTTPDAQHEIRRIVIDRR